MYGKMTFPWVLLFGQILKAELKRFETWEKKKNNKNLLQFFSMFSNLRFTCKMCLPTFPL